VRIKSRFHNRQRPKTTEELAGALAFIGWRMAQTRVNRLYSEGFNFHTNEQLLDVISEYLAFSVNLTVRLLHERPLDDAWRTTFINHFALRLADHLHDNRSEEQGPGSYREPFIALLNERLAEYGEFSFSSGEPGYPMRRYFGNCLEQRMGDNKWVLEQAAEVEVPELLKGLRKGIEDLLAQGEAVTR